MKTVEKKKIVKKFESVDEVEKFHPTLWNKYDCVKLVHVPIFPDEKGGGLYAWEVESWS